MTRKYRWAIGPLAVLLVVLAAAPALAADSAKTKCDLTFTLSEWAAVYKQAVGSGTITCENGKTLPVTIVSKGGGLAAGKFKIDGHGEFSAVSNIHELLGTYVGAEAHVGAVKSGETSVLTKGNVSLAVAGKGEGWNVGVSLGKFTISQRK